MAFTSWAQIVSDLKDKLADTTATNQILQAGYSTPDGSLVTFRKLPDLLEYYKFAQNMADVESNAGGTRTGMISFGYGGIG